MTPPFDSPGFDFALAFSAGPDECRECHGVGEWSVPVIHSSDDHVEYAPVTCKRCHGTGVAHCDHGLRTGDCSENECVVSEVLFS